MEPTFKKSRVGYGCSLFPTCDVPVAEIPAREAREKASRLPQVAEIDISRHYTELMKRTHGVNDGFYPLGSCTMKYNSKLSEEMAVLPGFIGVHSLQPEEIVQGCLEVLVKAEELFCETTDMDQITFRPMAGAHGEYTGLLPIKAYHKARGDMKRIKIIVPDTAHGTNPVSCTMVGSTIISIPSNDEGRMDLDKLREVVGDDTAGFMLTNPNTVGIFNHNIPKITKIMYEAGGPNYYDGANLNVVTGAARPGGMGFDVIHLNLHKTSSTPHGGGGLDSGTVGCRDILAPFLPKYHVVKSEKGYASENPAQAIGSVKEFYGNFLVVVRVLSYILVSGNEGIPEAAENAVLNASYMRVKLQDTLDIVSNNICMHESAMSMTRLKKLNEAPALDFAKGPLDHGVHPPTMYFPLIVDEALVAEPTETELKETLDNVVDIFKETYKNSVENPEAMYEAPYSTLVCRLDEVGVARNSVLKHFGWKQREKQRVKHLACI